MWTVVNNIYLDIESLYGCYNFVIKAGEQFDWQRYTSVLVTLCCRHRQQPTRILSRSYPITQTTSQVKLPVMLPDPDKYQFELSKSYSAGPNSPHISVVLKEPTSQDVYLSSTLYRQHTLILLANMDWHRVAHVTVFASYACSPAERLYQQFQFTESDAGPQCFSADQPDPERCIVDLDIWFTYQPGEGDGWPENMQISTKAKAIDLANFSQ
ncbi:hypothetical protein [Chromobacterium alticapitis]|uniref:Uncharacterized protein n=1 Tax=Chromobacterium alticapitis TaxID=2073169 RepID=A0A2S5DBG9_9NEIS|nr:hypothetical protein [Chromobacterium alticapitis]POZ60342.1 hypothetical protein C2I19_19400 [Chromobacterium alticapitis]